MHQDKACAQARPRPTAASFQVLRQPLEAVGVAGRPDEAAHEHLAHTSPRPTRRSFLISRWEHTRAPWSRVLGAAAQLQKNRKRGVSTTRTSRGRSPSRTSLASLPLVTLMPSTDLSDDSGNADGRSILLPRIRNGTFCVAERRQRRGVGGGTRNDGQGSGRQMRSEARRLSRKQQATLQRHRTQGPEARCTRVDPY
jgi:hypothetical protein